MKICFVFEYYPPHIGGGEIFSQQLVEGVSKLIDQCIVITSKDNCQIPSLEEIENIKIIRVHTFSFWPRFWFSLFAPLKIIIFARDCNIIIGTTYGGGLPAFLGAKILRKKSILIVHEFMGGLWRNLEINWFSAFFYQTFEKFLAHLSFDKFIAVSRYTRNCLRFLGVPDSKLEFVYEGENKDLQKNIGNPIDIRKDLGFTADDFIYLVYGRAGVTKGFNFFIDAIPMISEKVPNSKFILILTKSNDKIWHFLMEKIKKIPKSLYRLMSSLPREELSAILNISDCIVIPSLSEGFGLAALEACSLNKKVVTTDAGSLPEVVYGHHIFVKPSSPEALAEGCWRAYLGQMDYASPKKFCWTESIRQFYKIFKEILNK